MRTALTCLLLGVASLAAQEVKPFRWSGKLVIPDPTSVTVDEAGNVYVACTARRKAADLDIREHQMWIPDDVALTSPEEKLAFFRRELAPGRIRMPRGGLKDHDKDGIIGIADLEHVKERIFKLSDTDGDGVADRMVLFAEGFNEANSGIAAGVLWHDGWVYVTALPHLWRLKDTDGDGRADITEKVVSGFGAHIAYAGHDMHGLRLGPDGRIWWTIGDKGLNVTTKDGRRFVYPHQGAVMRCEPDGSGFEVFAHGLRNIQEIAFNEHGEVFGVDNDGDAPRERERTVYILDGSDSGWRNQHQYQKSASRWLKENMWMPQGQPDQPLFITPPIANYSDGPAGFLREPGHALDGTLQGHYLLNQFPKGRMDAFRLVPDRDGFRMEDVRAVSSGIMGIGLSWAPDGRAYFADWAGGYPLDEKGAVWRFDVASKVDTTSAEWLARPLSQPVPAEVCLSMLGHRDQRVRINASIRLARASAWEGLLKVAKDDSAPAMARIHAIWGWGMGLRQGKVQHAEGIALLNSKDDEVKAQALKVLGEAKSPDAALRQALLAQLGSASIRVRMQAALALGRTGGSARIGDFVRDADGDFEMPWLRHCLVTGIAACVAEDELIAACVASDEHVADFAVLALARRRSAKLAQALGSPHDSVVNEAARAIHDDEGVPSALPALAASLDRHVLPAQAMRRAVNACLRLGTPEDVLRLVRRLRGAQDSALLTDVLECMLAFDAPPRLDRVDGVARSFSARDRQAVSKALAGAREVLLGQNKPDLRVLAFSVLLRHGIDVPAPALVGFAKDKTAPAGVRADAIRMLAAKDPAQAVKSASEACADGNPSELRIDAFEILVGTDPSSAFAVGQAIMKSRGAKSAEKQAVIRAATVSASPEARQIFNAAVDSLLSGKLDATLKLEVIAAARAASDQALRARVDSYLEKDSGPRTSDGMPYAALADGGDSARGKRVVNEHLNANCTGCHRVESDEGSEVGPKLRGLTVTKERTELVESLVAPSAKVSPGFGVATYTLKDGSVVSGAPLQENATKVVVRLPEGGERSFARSDVVSSTPAVSVMPPMLGILTHEEIRDVVAYLSTLKPRSTKKK
jgi:putative membrane-bound dehydrogenase-like protein